MFIKNASLFTIEGFEESFFGTKNFLRIFFITYAENCRTLAMNFFSIIRSAFH